MNSVKIHFAPTAKANLAHDFAARLGVPFPQGKVRDASLIRVRDQHSTVLPCQVVPLAYWPDQSLKWSLVDWIVPGNQNRQAPENYLEIDSSPSAVNEWKSDSQEGKCSVSSSENRDHLIAIRDAAGPIADLCVRCTDGEGGEHFARPNSISLHQEGPVCSRFRIKFTFDSNSALSHLVGTLTLDLYPTLSNAVCRLTLTNTEPAGHPNGNWDLGNAGSVYLSELSVALVLPEKWHHGWIKLHMDDEQISFTKALELFQASSGGANWNSTNHLDRDHQVPLGFRGFKLRSDELATEGLRATPQVYLEGHERRYGIGCRRFWENFPKSFRTDEDRIVFGLFPKECGYLHELQGGEQKTHDFAICFGASVESCPLDVFVDPSIPCFSPEYYSLTQAFPNLTPRDTKSNSVYDQLVDLAITGEDTFHSKREKIDEYGWRNFGDIYGDHEAVFHGGPKPLISHYNNQYDCTGGFAAQFLRSGNMEWFHQMIEMADHAWDIDTYHTEGDKSLYNGGLFWHTYHYADADTGNHRSYPKSLTQSKILEGGKDLKDLGATGKALSKNYAIGGGPSASQNYSTGWMWAYYLTGVVDYREAAINAANYVIAIEDGRRTIFRWVSRADTGMSIESSSGYHGPGRASANSLHALLTGFELTNDAKYLHMAQKLMLRVVHPDDNIDSLDLGNAELRWFYTMYLQALTRYIDLKSAFGQNDMFYGYAIAAFNHYSQWMLENERPTLDQADKLHYPTETWAAQDMRKWHVLQYAAWLNRENPSLHARYQEKADFFFKYVCDTLGQSPTRSLCRPVVLMLQFGWQRNWFKNAIANASFIPPQHIGAFPGKLVFRTQREIAVGRAKKILLLLGAVGTLLLVAVLIAILVLVLF